MENFYIVCAAAGMALLVCQLLLGLLGLGGHHEFGGDHELGADHEVGHDLGHSDGHHDSGHGSAHSWFVGILSFRALVAALTFFGLGGWLATKLEGFDAPLSLAVAVAAGGGALFVVGWMMRTLARLQSEGTVRIERSVGKTGTVYLPVPAKKAGCGKVHLNLQNRTVEYQAVTSEDQLPSGAKIVVVGVVSTDTVEVAPANDSGRTKDV
jgi:hypothetical protein